MKHLTSLFGWLVPQWKQCTPDVGLFSPLEAGRAWSFVYLSGNSSVWWQVPYVTCSPLIFNPIKMPFTLNAPQVLLGIMSLLVCLPKFYHTSSHRPHSGQPSISSSLSFTSIFLAPRDTFLLSFETTVPITDPIIQNVVKTSAGVKKKKGLFQHTRLCYLTEGLRGQRQNLSSSFKNSSCYPLATAVRIGVQRSWILHFKIEAKTLRRNK